jgi:hypothetical protein
LLLHTNPFGAVNESKEFQSMLQQMKPDELQQVFEGTDVITVAEPAATENNRGLQFANDKEVLKELIHSDDQIESYSESDQESILNDLSDEEGAQVVSILQQQSTTD